MEISNTEISKSIIKFVPSTLDPHNSISNKENLISGSSTLDSLSRNAEINSAEVKDSLNISDKVSTKKRKKKMQV